MAFYVLGATRAMCRSASISSSLIHNAGDLLSPAFLRAIKYRPLSESACIEGVHSSERSLHSEFEHGYWQYAHVSGGFGGCAQTVSASFAAFGEPRDQPRRHDVSDKCVSKCAVFRSGANVLQMRPGPGRLGLCTRVWLSL